MSKSDYILLLGSKSKTKYHELIEECLNYYNTSGTKDLTEIQLAEFCKRKGFV